MTEYFFWPRKDAWEELKAALDTRGWIGERAKVLLLNQCTEVRSRRGAVRSRVGGRSHCNQPCRPPLHTAAAGCCCRSSAP